MVVLVVVLVVLVVVSKPSPSPNPEPDVDVDVDVDVGPDPEPLGRRLSVRFGSGSDRLLLPVICVVKCSIERVASNEQNLRIRTR